MVLCLTINCSSSKSWPFCIYQVVELLKNQNYFNVYRCELMLAYLEYLTLYFKTINDNRLQLHAVPVTLRSSRHCGNYSSSLATMLAQMSAIYLFPKKTVLLSLYFLGDLLSNAMIMGYRKLRLNVQYAHTLDRFFIAVNRIVEENDGLKRQTLPD